MSVLTAQTPDAGSLDLARLHADAGALSFVLTSRAAASGVVAREAWRDGLHLADCRLRLDGAHHGATQLPAGLSVLMLLDQGGDWQGQAAIGPGDCVLDIAPEPHWRHVRAAAGSSFHFVSLTAPADWLERVGLGQARARHVSRAMPARVAALARFLARPGPASPAAALMREGAALEAIGLLLGEADAAPASLRMTGRERRALAILRDIIATEHAQDLSLGALARRTGLSLTRMKALHREAFGQGVGAAISEARLSHAAALLDAGGLQVAEVAYAVGYTPAHFATAFRQRYGVTPRAYRARR